MYMTHVCFYGRYCECVVVSGNVCCVAVVVKNSGFSPWSGEVCCVYV